MAKNMKISQLIDFLSFFKWFLLTPAQMKERMRKQIVWMTLSWKSNALISGKRSPGVSIAKPKTINQVIPRKIRKANLIFPY